LKKFCLILSIVLLLARGLAAQSLIGRVTEQDSAHTPIFMAEVTQMQDGRALATYKTYFDGTYRIKVKPSQTYQLKVSFPGKTDTTVTISVDKHATLYSGTLFISLRKDGLRLTGFILDRVQDLPISDAAIILKNVMTRREDKYITDVNGSYNLKMDYETNYILRVDKFSPGIINKYEDTSFNISTIGFNLPLDFRLDIKLDPRKGYTAPPPGYDLHARPDNRNLKPALVVLGIKDSVKKREQDSVIALLNTKLNTKDSVIASLDKRISAASRVAVENKVALRDDDMDTAKTAREAAKLKELEKAEEDLKAKQQAEMELQAKLDKEIKEAEARRQEQARIVRARIEKAQKDKDAGASRAALAAKQKADAAQVQAEQDSLLRIAEAKNREIMAQRKHVLDSLIAIESQKPQAKTEQNKSLAIARQDAKKPQPILTEKQKKLQAARAQAEQDSLVRLAEVTNRTMTVQRKHILDSLISIESQKSQARAPAREQTQAVKLQAEQDSLVRIAITKNHQMMAERKRVQDSLLDADAAMRSAQITATNEDTRPKDSLWQTDTFIRQKEAEDLAVQEMLAKKQAAADKKRADLAAQAKLEKEQKATLTQAQLKKAQQEQAAAASKKQAEIAAQIKLEKEQQQKLAQEQAQLKKEQEEQEAAAAKRQAEIAAQEKLEKEQQEKIAQDEAQLKKTQEAQEAAANAQAELEAAQKKAKLEKDLEDIKKAREVAEAKVLKEKKEKEERDKLAKKESDRKAKELAGQPAKQQTAQELQKHTAEEQQRIAARKAEAEAEQHELEARKALEEQEKKKLAMQLGNIQKDEQVRVTKNQETKQQEYNPEQALKTEQAQAVDAYEARVGRENRRKADSLAHVVNITPGANGGGKLIKARGYVRNGQTDEAIGNVSINIRRLNSIVSQEVTSDTTGRYDILVDSGYFYLVSYYKDKYEISKQILDLTAYKGADYPMMVQYLKEKDDFDPNAKMPVIQFDRNSSRLPADIWSDLQAIVKMMKDVPGLKVMLYGLASVDEDYPMELSVTRARLVADLFLESGIKPARMRINGIGAYRPRSGCTESKPCTQDQYKLDRVVMYKVIKE
jgi:outer membrane protein OmpA-like peptidoglycan-associated protein